MADPGNQQGLSESIDLSPVLGAFVDNPAGVKTIAPLGAGNINDTFLVTRTDLPGLVVQRINQTVFPDPVCVATNVALVSGHLQERSSSGLPASARVRFPEVIGTVDGRNYWEDRYGSVWRCLSYIDGTISYEQLSNKQQPVEVGRVLGSFHGLLSDFDTSLLCDPLPGFHDLQSYREAYLSAISRHLRPTGAAFDYCRDSVEKRLEIPDLKSLARTGQATPVVIHADPKLDNFLFNSASGRAESLIDLDTVSAGLVAMDLGDCLRSLGNPAGEKGIESRVYFDIEVAQLLLDGYRQRAMLSESDRNLIYQGLRLQTYELGLRFFTDYLAGDRYFKIQRRDENLRRAMVQFTLLESIEKQRSSIETAVGAG
jgi:Ser/Thr protein kinase RdoA (MazF antagonist)